MPSGPQVRADLREAELRLPAPLAKARGEPLAVLLRSIDSGADSWLLDLEAGGRATGRLAFVRRDRRWQFDRGQIGVAERVTRLPARDGLTLSARLASLNIDRWWQFLRADVDGGAGGGWHDAIRHVAVDVDALEVFGRPLWRAGYRTRSPCRPLAGPDAGRSDCRHRDPDRAGAPGRRVLYARSGAAGHRSGPDPAGAAVGAGARSVAAHRPAQSADAGHHQRGIRPGRTQLRCASNSVRCRWRPAGRGSRNCTCYSRMPAWKLTGLWAADRAGDQTTTVDVSLQASDSGRLLADLGYPNEMIGGKLLLTAKAACPVRRAEFAFATLDSAVNISLDMGACRRSASAPGACSACSTWARWRAI
ncbi:MAG: hypothetical protein MZV65_45400 [Chromatiales bacterium]|nr:hypothetical protein [Chromatiales bacterium]